MNGIHDVITFSANHHHIANQSTFTEKASALTSSLNESYQLTKRKLVKPFDFIILNKKKFKFTNHYMFLIVSWPPHSLHTRHIMLVSGVHVLSICTSKYSVAMKRIPTN